MLGLQQKFGSTLPAENLHLKEPGRIIRTIENTLVSSSHPVFQHLHPHPALKRGRLQRYSTQNVDIAKRRKSRILLSERHLFYL